MERFAVQERMLEDENVWPLGNTIRPSQSHPHPQPVGEGVNSPFEFALGWPSAQVSCSLPTQGDENYVSYPSPEIQLSDQPSRRGQEVPGQWQFILQCFQGSGKSEDEIRAAVHALYEIIQCELTDIVTESNSAYVHRLQNVLRKLGTADGIRFPTVSHRVYDTSTVRQGEELSPTSMGPLRNYVPPEIMAMIISQTLIAEPKCALDLVVPDWKICCKETPELEESVRMTRIVTYTKDIEYQVGTLSCNFGHKFEDHILTSMANFDASAAVANVSFSSEYTRQFVRSHTHLFTLGASDLPLEAVEEALVSDWRQLMPLRTQSMEALLPFDDEPIEAAKMRMSLLGAPIYQHFRHIAVHAPLELMKINAQSETKDGNVVSQQYAESLNAALDLDRSAHLWLSWSQMPNLESVFLDLRIYSHELNTQRRCLSKYQIIDRAREMGRHLRLKTLLLAGLQSYSFQTEYDDVTARDVETWDEIDGEPNWIKIFSPAIRRGGSIVLVDRLTDHVCLPLCPPGNGYVATSTRHSS